MKILVDTELYDDQWFQPLHPYLKLLYDYIYRHCNYGGIWSANKRLAEFKLGFNAVEWKLDWDQAIEAYNSDRERFVVLDNGDWWMIDYMVIRYTLPIREVNKQSLPGLKALYERGLIKRWLQYYPGEIVWKDTYDSLKHTVFPSGGSDNGPKIEEVQAFARQKFPNASSETIREFFFHYAKTHWIKSGQKVDWKFAIEQWMIGAARRNTRHGKSDRVRLKEIDAELVALQNSKEEFDPATNRLRLSAGQFEKMEILQNERREIEARIEQKKKQTKRPSS